MKINYCTIIKLKKYLLLASMLLILVSCEKLIINNDIENTPYNNFSHLWQKVKIGYSFFDIKNVNWDTVYTEYNKKIHNEMSNEELFDVLANMLNELKDGHVNLYSPFKTSRYDFSENASINYNFTNIKTNYLKNEYIITGPFIHAYINNDENQNDEIAYIRYSTFANTLTEQNLDYIFQRYSNTKGIIIDIRQNPGGKINNVFKLLSRLIDKKTYIYSTKIKNGYMYENDTMFSKAEKVYISPSENTKYLKKTLLLTDRGSYSASSFMSLSCKAIDNVVIIGDTTGGGLGMPNGGQLPNGWTYRFSVTRTLSAKENENWENGVPPDLYQIIFNNQDSKDIDEIIEKAIEEINK